GRRTLRRSPAGGPWPGRRGRAARSCGASIDGEAFDPHREADGGDRLSAAQPRQQVVVAAAGDQRIAGARRIGEFEHEAGVIVEAATEGRREVHALEVDALRGKEAGAALEQV